jgi:hypothetical protein
VIVDRPIPVAARLTSQAHSPAPTAETLMDAFEAALAAYNAPLDYVVPGLNLPCRLVVIGSERILDLESQVRRLMASRELPANELTEGNFELQRAVVLLSEAAIKPANPANPNEPHAPLLTREQWGRVPPSIVTAAYNRLSDLFATRDPLAHETSLSALDYAAFRSAIEKKNRDYLRYCGVDAVIDWLFTTEDRRISSPIPRYWPGDPLPMKSNGVEEEEETAPPPDSAT